MNAGNETELRALQQGASARGARCAHLQLRVHVLRELRRAARERVPELRRRLCGAAGAAGAQLEGRQLPGRLSGEQDSQAPAGRPRGARALCRRHQRDTPGEAVSMGPETQAFLTNCWYVAAWDNELID